VALNSVQIEVCRFVEGAKAEVYTVVIILANSYNTMAYYCVNSALANLRDLEKWLYTGTIAKATCTCSSSTRTACGWYLSFCKVTEYNCKVTAIT
jgi:hypothetical protein